MIKGVYTFDPARLADFHSVNLAAVKGDINRGESCVVSNTFTRRWEIAPYLQLNAHILVFRMMTPLDVCIARNTHNVPAAVITNMYHRMEPVEGEYLVNGN